MNGTLAIPDSQKLIGGCPHVKVPCINCGLLIWTSTGHETQDGSYVELCSDCDSKHKSRRKIGRSDKAAGVDISYHGQGV